MMLYKLLSQIDRNRFEPSVISLIDQGTIGERIQALDIPVYTLEFRPGWSCIKGLSRLASRVRELQPHLLQGWMYHGNLAALLASRLVSGSPPPVVWNVRQTLYDLNQEKPGTRLMIKLSGKFSKAPAAIVYNSIVSAEQHEKVGFAENRRNIIPNGFDCDYFAPSLDARNAARTTLALHNTEIVIGLAARTHPMKDHPTFLKAAAILAKQNPRVTYLMAGRGVDAQNLKLTALIDNQGLAGRVRLLGDIKDMRPFYSSLDIATLSSAWGEGFPNVLGEAMAFSVPCVATQIGESAAIIGETGKIIPPNNPEALAAAWSELAEDPQYRQTLGSLARTRIKENYSLAAVTASYEKMYTQQLSLN